MQKKWGFILFILWAMMGCKEEKLPTLPTKMSSDIVSEAFQMRYTYSQNAVVTARLQTGHVIEKMEGPKDAQLNVHYLSQGVSIRFYGSDGNEEMHLNAREGRIDKKSGLADLKGNVVAIGKDGQKLESEQLFWDQKQEKIYTLGYVKITTANRTLEGDGFESNTSLTRYKILKARGKVEVENME